MGQKYVWKIPDACPLHIKMYLCTLHLVSSSNSSNWVLLILLARQGANSPLQLYCPVMLWGDSSGGAFSLPRKSRKPEKTKYLGWNMWMDSYELSQGFSYKVPQSHADRTLHIHSSQQLHWTERKHSSHISMSVRKKYICSTSLYNMCIFTLCSFLFVCSYQF